MITKSICDAVIRELIKHYPMIETLAPPYILSKLMLTYMYREQQQAFKNGLISSVASMAVLEAELNDTNFLQVYRLPSNLIRADLGHHSAFSQSEQFKIASCFIKMAQDIVDEKYQELQ